MLLVFGMSRIFEQGVNRHDVLCCIASNAYHSMDTVRLHGYGHMWIGTLIDLLHVLLSNFELLLHDILYSAPAADCST